MFDAFQKFLPKAAAEYNFTKQMKAAEVCQEFRSLSKKLLSPEAQEQTFPRHYQDGTLTVGAINSAAAEQLSQQKHLLLEAINKKFGPKTLQKIKVQVSEHPAQRGLE